ncbi:DUF7619 domain-containing protein [Flavobacterium sp. SM2513]|uniref:DUF7619 domain-containing protein n=1 Tax=Flavobacterium sp. SM2513 TaxID=3424766 RepID=UPI003D7F973E
MKKYYLLLLFVASWMNAQIVTIPDAAFKERLLASSSSFFVAKNLQGNFFSIDANDDGEIQLQEAQQVTYLRLYDLPINSLEGIEAFTNLTELQCWKLNLTTLDVSALTQLKLLNCAQNDLDIIDISALSNLETFLCDDNNLTTLNFLNNPNLLSIGCSDNLLTTLDVSNLANLNQLVCYGNFLTTITFPVNNSITSLYIYNNLLTSLDFSILPNLTNISCDRNNFTSLAFDNLPNLTFIDCGGTQLSSLTFNNLPSMLSLNIHKGTFPTFDISSLSTLTRITLYNTTNLATLDLSNLPLLNFFQCTGNASINSLDISNNPLLNDILINNNPLIKSLNFKNGTTQNIDGMFFDSSLQNLEYICADEGELQILQTEMSYFYPTKNIAVNTYCSFNPGGNYNKILGAVTFDSNNNGCDETDEVLPNIRININDGVSQGATFASNSGNYGFYTQAGNFTLTPSIENPSYFNFSPVTATIPFANNNNNLVIQNFCITANGIHPDLEIVIVPIIPARPGFDAVYKIVYKNKGNQTVGSSVNLTFNDSVLDFVTSSVVPTLISGSTYNWNVGSLAPFQAGSILVTFNVNSPQEIPAVNIDDILTFNANINLITDVMPNDNSFEFNQIVVGSYDPNDITCLQGNALPTSEMGAYLHYNIRFENTGTAPAENIVVKNTIDLTQYNIQSLQIMESSHPMTVRVTGNIAEFIFEAIDLDTGGHGNILLKLKSNATLTNDLVINSADIFFDYNFPIITNDEQTVFADLSKNDFVKDASIQVYPNPTDNLVTIKADNAINSIQLYDAQGRLLSTKMTNENTQTLDLSNYSSGVYFLNISTAVGKQTQKIIKK